jgi:hypothetical protein
MLPLIKENIKEHWMALERDMKKKTLYHYLKY